MKFLLLLALAALAQGRPDTSKVDSRLLRSFKTADDPLPNIFITFKQGTQEVIEAIEDTRFDTRADRLNALHDGLVSLADQVQNGVKALLDGKFEYKSLWVTNQIYVKEATMEFIMQLAARDDIKSVTQEEVIELDTIIEGPIIKGRQDPTEEWGIVKIQAAAARTLLNTHNSSVQASPVIVSTIDTGCRYTHEALRDNWLGEYGWFDPYDANRLPMDINGHGTHTTGTIAGKGGIGVYPDAKWTSCRGCATSSCMQSALLACAQFIVCPTLSDGTASRCEKAPNLVSNSWGGGRGATWFDDAIAAFHAAQIVPLFSIGNSGPSCNTANSPGDRNVLGVGSTTVLDALSSFSSVGPTIDGRMKPDISAPGSDVLSAYHTSDDAYRSLSGTSMACPHAAGLTSLLLAYNPSLTFDQVKELIQGETDRELVGGKTCEGFSDDTFPNHHFGHGRINALKSLTKAINSRK